MGKTMATPTPTLRPLSCWKSILRHSRQQKAATRSLTTYHKPAPLSKAPLPPPSQAPTRLTYMRKPKHDMGSVQNIVLAYQRSRGALRGSGLDQQKKGGAKKKGKGRK